MTNFRILLTTTSTAAEADRIATALVDRRLAACVNILPNLKSIYRWQDASAAAESNIEQAEELLLIIKTDEAHIPAIESAIRSLHSYELPECITLPILSGTAPYLAWLANSLK
jgi:periplasmic divalent cation tolerance protein